MWCEAASKVDASAVQPRLYGAGRGAKRRRNLLARESFDVMQKDGIALRRRQQRDRVAPASGDDARSLIARVRLRDGRGMREIDGLGAESAWTIESAGVGSFRRDRFLVELDYWANEPEPVQPAGPPRRRRSPKERIYRRDLGDTLPPAQRAP